MSNNGINKARRKYDEGFKRDALKMVANGQPIRLVAQDLGIGENLLHKWKAAGRLQASGLERDILKKSLEHFLPRELEARYRVIESEMQGFAKREVFKLLKVDKSSFTVGGQWG